MPEINQLGSERNKAQCDHCEAMLTEALDHLLSPDDQAIFDRHLASCADCSRMYKDARRGADWLVMLKDAQPEPPAALLKRILATTGPANDAIPVAQTVIQSNTLLSSPQMVPVAVAPVYTGNVLPFRKRVTNAFRLESVKHTFMQPRLAMTAAMAFFSIALTLNLTGVRLTQLRASDLKPSSLKRTFYDANARVMRSVDNLRVVYELESRVRDLQRDSENNTPAPVQNSPSADPQQDDQKAPSQKDKQKQTPPRPRSGSSRSTAPGQMLRFTASAPLHDPQAGLPLPASRHEQVSFVTTPNVFKPFQGGQA